MKNYNKKLQVCFFGAYDKTYTSNLIVMQGLKENGVEVVEVNYDLKVTRLDTTNDMSWRQLMKRIIRKYKLFSEIIKKRSLIKTSDIIYVGYPGHFEVLIAFVVAKFFQKKVFFFPVITFYTGFADDQGILPKNSFKGNVIKLGEKLIYNLCDVVLPDTPDQLEHIHKLFGIPKNKLKSLPIGADDRYYKYTPYSNNEKKINVTYYGLYTPLHGVEHIIEAAKILKNDTDIHFTFVGIGPTFEPNYKKAQELGLQNVSFYYDVPVEKHPAIIEKADIFFGFLQDHPTVHRVIPNKVYQGLALGKVVVTADASVSRSLFENGKNLYLVQPSSGEKLAKLLLFLKNNPSKRKEVAENGYSLFTEKFTPKAVGRQLIEYIQEVL